MIDELRPPSSFPSVIIKLDYNWFQEISAETGAVLGLKDLPLVYHQASINITILT